MLRSQSRSRKRKLSEPKTHIEKRRKLSRGSTKRQPIKSVTKRLAFQLKKQSRSSQSKKKSKTFKNEKQASIIKKKTMSARRKLSKLKTGSKTRSRMPMKNTTCFKIVTLDKAACMMCATKTAFNKALTCYLCDQVAHRACAVKDSPCWRNSGKHFICDFCLVWTLKKTNKSSSTLWKGPQMVHKQQQHNRRNTLPSLCVYA